MILVAVGGNLAAPGFGSPVETCAASLAELERRGIQITLQSQWYDTAPVPVSDQPWFVNGVVAVAAAVGPHALLAILQDVESSFGRRRSVPNAARTLDLDLLAYDGRVVADGARLILPHPRMHERAFVLLPLAEIVPDWRHPVTGRSVAEMIAALPHGQRCVPSAQRKK
ncbi:MAG: 2-amino-4-hydroxy-6-hydroxymethyldihydropteridine diphosphokinase [Rhodospirillaceae bacterium]